VKPRNIILILTDDHRYDAFGYMGHPFLETPRLDALIRDGVHFSNAFVTTSLCSPSRASILTGLYMHNHKVVDNYQLIPEEDLLFPELLQEAGYKTAFVGKWHMGGISDAPRRGFDHWVSFSGQGYYYPPENREWSLNIDGHAEPQKGYLTDELTDYALEWLNLQKEQDNAEPFFLFLSHKAAHGFYEPAERHKGRYSNAVFPEPDTMADTPENYNGKPMWVKNQRNSWHGVDFAYHSKTPIEKYYQLYSETILAVDESVGRIRDWLADQQLEKETLIIYMDDNGFLWGEHGLIDKRNAYEPSMRIPLIAFCPDLLPSGTTVNGMVANIDIAPTILAAAGLRPLKDQDGRSFLDLAAGRTDGSGWRNYLLYEYYWEWAYPQTPSTFALRGTRYKLIQYHGIWDTDELYDIQADPGEKTNLILVPEYGDLVLDMKQQLYEMLQKDTGETVIRFGMKKGPGASLRSKDGAEAAEFPDDWIIQ
jgi:N-acetylglucosamine-6-sulfatase